MNRTSTLALRAAVLMALVGNGCVHTEIAPPPQASVGAAPAPTVAATPGQPATPAVSPAAAEVVRLAEAGTSDDVILAYIQNDTAPFDLSADQILYLRDIGVSSGAITAMLSRDNVLRSQPVPAGGPPPAPVEPPPVAVSAPLVPETPPVYVGSPPPEVGYFYDDLSPYGSWVQLDGVGWCWQPRVVVVNRSWRPYCDSGHWVFSDAGWFWQSDYSWGWAPFHYGRWQLHERCGWVWTPDRVWGPAWVTWRSEGDHCGWAPLPPHAEFDVHLGYRFNGVAVAATFDFGLRPDHFTFIAVRDFHDHDYAHRRLAPTEVTRIYNHTTVINNYVVNNNTVINQGIRPEQVASATHTEIHKVAIRNVSAPSAAVATSRGAARGELAVYRPELKAPARPVNIVAQKVDQNHPVIQRPPPIATTTQLANSAPNLDRGNPNRGAQGSISNPGRGPAPGQPQTTPRANVANTQPYKAPAANQPSYPSRSAPNTPDNHRPGAPAQNAPATYPKGNPQAGEGRAKSAQANPRPAERGNAKGRDNGDRGQDGRRNDQ
jgi:hypothetical protein